MGRGKRGAGPGEELGPPQKQTGVYLFMSDTTQFDFPHKRSNNISVTVNYTPQKHIKGRSASAQPLLRRAACAQISRPASRRLQHFEASAARKLRGSRPHGPLRLGWGRQGASWALRPLAGLSGLSHSQLMPGLPTKIVALVAVFHRANFPAEEKHPQ